jgi:hypothetical protein
MTESEVDRIVKRRNNLFLVVQGIAKRKRSPTYRSEDRLFWLSGGNPDMIYHV